MAYLLQHAAPLYREKVLRAAERRALTRIDSDLAAVIAALHPLSGGMIEVQLSVRDAGYQEFARGVAAASCWAP